MRLMLDHGKEHRVFTSLGQEREHENPLHLPTGCFRLESLRTSVSGAHGEGEDRLKRADPEQRMQIMIADTLRRVLPPTVFFTAFPAGGGGAVRGAYLQAMGLAPGVPDLLFFHQGRAYGIELKAGSRLTAAQAATHALLGHAGVPTRVCHALSDVLAALVDWKIPMRIKPEVRRAA